MEAAPDPTYAQFRRRSVKLACGVSLAAAAMILAYIAATWDRPNRGVLAAIAVGVVVAVALIYVLRAERLVDTRWCDPFFLAWSTGYVVMIAAFALLDGGIASPLVITFFPVCVFAGLCYPLRLAVYVGVACVFADVAVGLASPPGHFGTSLYIAGALTLTAVMCAWQAYSHDRHRRELAQTSRTDHLTGILNRRGFHERAAHELARAERSGDPVSIVLIDLDRFKRVNDVHGHGAGDDLLRWVADRLSSGLRPGDAAGRIGGDEFALLLPGVGREGGRVVAERKRALISRRTSASFGVAAALAPIERDVLLAEADAELYREKQLGRTVDRVQTARARSTADSG